MVYDPIPAHPATNGAPAASAPWPNPLPTRSLQGLGLALRVLLLVDLVVALLALVLSIRIDDAVGRVLADPDSVTLDELTTLDQLSTVAAFAWFGCYVATGVVWLVWLYRARDNVEAWSPQFQRSGQGATIYSWFIPFANLVWPARIMRDVLEDTERDSSQRWSERRGQPLVTVWAVFFAAMVLSGAWLRVKTSGAVSVDGLDELGTASVVDAVITVVAVIPAVLLVGRLTEAQQRRIELERYEAAGPTAAPA